MFPQLVLNPWTSDSKSNTNLAFACTTKTLGSLYSSCNSKTLGSLYSPY